MVLSRAASPSRRSPPQLPFVSSTVNPLQELLHFGRVQIQRSVSGNRFKFDAAQLIVVARVVTDETALSVEGTFDGEIRMRLDKIPIEIIGGCRTGEVTAFLHQQSFGSETFLQLFAEHLPDVDIRQFQMSESIAFHFFTLRFHETHNAFRIDKFADKDVQGTDALENRL